GHMIQATGKVVNKQTYRFNGKSRVSNGIRFEQIATADQDEISKYLFWQIAPQEGEMLSMTHASQTEPVIERAPEPALAAAEPAKAGPAKAQGDSSKSAKAGGQ